MSTLSAIRKVAQTYRFRVLAVVVLTSAVLTPIGTVTLHDHLMGQVADNHREYLAGIELALNLSAEPDLLGAIDAWVARLRATEPRGVLASVSVTQDRVEIAQWTVAADAQRGVHRTLMFTSNAESPLQVTLWSRAVDSRASWGEAARIVGIRSAVATSVLLWVAWWLVRGPARSVRAALAFLSALPTAVGSRIDTRGHTLEVQRLMESMNRASDLLAAQQKRLQDLNEESRRFASVVQSTSVGFILTDSQSTITWVNEGFTRLTGYGLGQAVGLRPTQLLKSIGAQPDTLQCMRERVAAGEHFSGDLLVERRNGQRIWLNVAGEPVLDERGVVIGFMLLHTDADARMRAVYQLQRGQSILRAVANVAESLLRNPHWEAALAEALEQLTHASGAQRAFVYELRAGVELVRIESHYASAFERDIDDEPSRLLPVGGWQATIASGATITLGTFPWRVDTPEQRDGSVVLAPVRIADAWWGVVVFDGGIGAEAWTEVERLAFGTAANILAAAIENGVNERALRSERAFASEVLERIFDGVAVVDEAGLVRFANPALQQMLQRDEPALVGRSLAALGLQPSASEQLVVRDIRPLGPHEATLPSPAGMRTLLVRASAEPLAGERPRRILLVTDVTERKRLELDLKRMAATAEAASEAKSRLLGRVSHELRTPLNAVIGFAQLAALDADTAELQESLFEIQRAGNHLNRLINDLIDLSSTQSGELTIAFEAVALEDVAQEALSLIRPASKQANVTLLPSILRPATVIADPGRLMQIVLNLLSNAVKYNRPGGTVSLRVLHSSDGSHGRLEVEDSGPGIAQEELPRLFIAFERLSNAGDRSGTGIGLALSSILAERMGGRIGVRSELGRGSCFWVEFALAPAKQQGAWGDARS